MPSFIHKLKRDFIYNAVANNLKSTHFQALVTLVMYVFHTIVSYANPLSRINFTRLVPICAGDLVTTTFAWKNMKIG